MGQLLNKSGSTILKPKYWYYIETSYCVLCGRTDTFKKRMYTPKPKEYNERHQYEEHMCDCKWQI
jgi:hypothetical protein